MRVSCDDFRGDRRITRVVSTKAGGADRRWPVNENVTRRRQAQLALAGVDAGQPASEATNDVAVRIRVRVARSVMLSYH
eukprot:5493743-Pleurochrysis_carterae.AAC.1